MPKATAEKLADNLCRCRGRGYYRWSWCYCGHCQTLRERLSRTGSGPCDRCTKDAALMLTHVGDAKTVLCGECAQVMLPY